MSGSRRAVRNVGIAALGDFQGRWEEGREDSFIVLPPTLSIRPSFAPLCFLEKPLNNQLQQPFARSSASEMYFDPVRLLRGLLS
jgi:hypothetical protein